MKNKCLVAIQSLLCIALFTQCTNKPAPGDSEAAQTPAALDASKMEGVWVNDAWWQSLLDSRSPKIASELAELSAVTIHQDSGRWVADVVYNWHEGMSFNLQAADEKYLLVDGMNNNLKGHEITPQPDGSIYLDTFPFVRIGDIKTGFAAISAAILGGTYLLEGKGGKVSFNADGTLTGLGKYSRYELLTDYVTDQVGSDQLMLYTGADNMPEFFAFQLKANKLSIFPLLEDQEKQIYTLDKVRYQLLKTEQ